MKKQNMEIDTNWAEDKTGMESLGALPQPLTNMP